MKLASALLRVLGATLILFTGSTLRAGTIEAGRATIQSTFGVAAPTDIAFSAPFPTTPAVFITPTIQGGDPSDLRVVRTGTNGFSVLQVEPINNDGPHIAMNTGYIAATPGVHSIATDDDTMLYEVLCIDTDAEISETLGTGAALTLNFAHTFATTPVVVADIQTLLNEENDIPNDPSSPFASVGIIRVSTTAMQIAIERSETDENGGAGSSISVPERLCYLAIEEKAVKIDQPGCTAVLAAELGGVDGWDATPQCRQVDFGNIFPDDPIIVVDKNQRRETDGGWARICETNSNGATVTIDQDRTGDNEREHGRATVGTIGFGEPCRLEVATPVVIDEVFASQTHIAFSSASERGALLYNIERYVPGKGYLSVNKTPLEANWTRARGGRYLAKDPYAKRYGRATLVRIVELDNRQQTRRYGPFRAQKKEHLSHFKTQKVSHALERLREQLTPKRVWPFAPGRVRMSIDAPGIYRVSAHQVPHLSDIALRLNGRPLDAFSHEGDLLFYVSPDEALPSAVFADDEGAGALALSIGRRNVGHGAVMVRRVQQEQNIPVVTLAHDEGEDYWYQQGLLGAVADRARSRIVVDDAAISHRVFVRGASKGEHTIETSIGEKQSLHDFERLTFELSARSEIDLYLKSRTSALLIDKIESRFAFLGQRDEASLVVTASSDFEAKGYLVLSRNRHHQEGDRLVVAKVEALKTPSAIDEVGSDLVISDAEYLVVAPRAFKEALQPLMQERAKSMSVSFVAAEDVALYEGDARLGPDALARFIARVGARYVLLVGDGSLDPQGHLSPNHAPLPAKMIGTASGVFASDLALVDDKTAIGRVPARSIFEVETFVQKTLNFNAQAGHRVVADQNDEAGDFSNNALRIAKASEAQELTHVNAKGAIDLFGQSSAFVHFIGHGASDRLSKRRWLTSADVFAMPLSSSLPVVVAGACLVNRFELPGFSSLGEHLLFEPERGAAGVISSSGYSHDGNFHLWHLEFIRAQAQSETLGEAMTKALNFMRTQSNDLGYLNTLVLLGDPAMPLR